MNRGMNEGEKIKRRRLRRMWEGKMTGLLGEEGGDV
jgi:hypothetical protein